MASKTISKPRPQTSGGFEQPLIDLTSDGDGYDSDATLLDDEFQERFITPTPVDPQLPAEPDPSNSLDFRELGSFSMAGKTHKAGKTVELHDKDFLRITKLVEHRMTNEIIIYGIRFRRTLYFSGLFEMKKNEVVMLMKFDSNKRGTMTEQSTERVALDDILRIREMVKTNQPFSSLSYRECDPNVGSMGADYILANARLVCRWKHRSSGKNEGSIKGLKEEDCDLGCGMTSNSLRQIFRGDTILGGASAFWLPSEKLFDQKERLRSHYVDPLGFFDGPHSNAPHDRQRRYLCGDAFCGAGGASRGAKAAGARIDFGFDHNILACQSYQKNFFGTRCEYCAAYHFVAVIRDDFKVDILHVSPPCQTFSPAHTVLGKDDENNEATFLATEDLIKRTKPRVVTIEETFGLTRNVSNRPWFQKMVHMFTRLGFSIRWEVFNLYDFGLPQPRKRLILFASCPGEVLPDFPTPTHCKPADRHLYPNRKPLVTINQAIANIPTDASLHNPTEMPRRTEQPYDGNFPMKSTITCRSGVPCHPSGTRDFTLREIACLQGFPLEHEFAKGGARVQIGNAFPPIVAKAFFGQVIRTLRKTDGVL